MNGEGISQLNQIKPDEEITIWSSEETLPSNGHNHSHNTSLSSGKQAGNQRNLFLEKYFGGRSLQTLLLRTFHLLLGCNNGEERREHISSSEPKNRAKLHILDSRLILIKLLRYVNYEIRQS